jgi:SAM-dependent methyltransferase
MTATSGFTYTGGELTALAGALRYYGWILSHFRPYLGPTILEVGSGIGTFSQLLAREPIVRQLLLVEPADNLVPTLRAKFRANPRVQVIHGYMDDLEAQEPVDAVACVNVLEHVEDDLRFLRLARERLEYGGHLLLFVPALPWLFGTLDRAFGHYRRYTPASLVNRLTDAGFTPIHVRYMNLVGVLTWFLAGKVLRRMTITKFDVTVYDRFVVPWLSRAERLVPPPIGQSLIAVGRAD